LGEEIKHIARNSWNCHEISLSHFCENGDGLTMYHNLSFDKLKFMLTDNSKPLYYKEVVEIDDGHYAVIDKRFDDKFKYVFYNYPYYQKVTPSKIVSSWNMFKGWEYEFIGKSEDKVPNYDEVERLIYCALEYFKICA
jgi:hypothetical protein